MLRVTAGRPLNAARQGADEYYWAPLGRGGGKELLPASSWTTYWLALH